MGHKPLLALDVCHDVFNYVMTSYNYEVKFVENVDEKCRYGYVDRDTIWVDKRGRTLYCPLWMILDAAEELDDTDDAVQLAEELTRANDRCWRCCRVHDQGNDCAAVVRSVDGNQAYRYVMNQIKNNYEDDEIEEIFSSHSVKEENKAHQFHYDVPQENNTVIHYSNCVYYDISKTHWSYLCEMFPRIKDWALKHLNSESRAERQYWKNVGNYAVGYLCRQGRRETYNWIVKQVSDRILAAMDEVGGFLIYGNTDGFIVENPDRPLSGADGQFGHFKVEYEGDVYVLRGDNYTLKQIGPTLKGSCRRSARPGTDLANGIAPVYRCDGYGNVTDLRLEKFEVMEA